MKNYYTTPNYKLENPFYNAILSGTHILIAGCAGSGKSVLLNNLIEYIITNNSPNKTKLILCDPKQVEFISYAKLPHTIAYASDNDNIKKALENAIDIMESRYSYMAKNGLKLYDGKTIYIIIDELADLLTTGKKEIYTLLLRLSQKARASKILLICATQAPNRQIIPASFVLNFDTRIALRCFSNIESRQIIGKAGAENLPQHGFCMLRDNKSMLHEKCKIDMSNDARINKIVNFWNAQNYHKKKLNIKKINLKNINIQSLEIGKAFATFLKWALIFALIYAFYATM